MRIPTLLILFLIISSCQRYEKPKQDEPGGSDAAMGAQADAPVMPGPGTEVPGYPPGDPEIVALLDKVAKVCDVQPWGARITCPKREEDELRSWFFTGQKGIATALDTFSSYIMSHDEKGQTVAVDALRRIVNNLDPKTFDLAGDSPAIIGIDAWNRYHGAVQKVNNPRLFISQDSSLAILAALARQETAAFRLLEGYPATRLRALPHLMRFSRLRAFEIVKKLASQGAASGDLALTKACLSSASRMPEMTPEEQKVLCPWASELFQAAPAHLWTGVAKIYRNCPIDSLEPLVSHLEKEWLPENALAGEVAVVGDLLLARCAPDQVLKPAPVCVKLRKIVANIMNSPKTRPEVRKVCEGILPK
ncbi:MAG: hypothetical protein CVU65_09835 [Deltaproteobacteria bacterium HGW-Deltaproteobacteria-22]|jgi:hypothetical protein|nr:MAG: hypothetical protein CVU65_09835 [Deltaproteobacteria bacterium HGW-Deltaproteobacteria-22]